MTNSTSIPINTVKQFEQILNFGHLATYYGLTEASRSTFMIFNNQNKETSVGLPAPGVKIKIINNNGLEDNHGVIWINGPNVINKYWNALDVDNNMIDGWLNTGDIGYTDSDNYLYLSGRVDDVINVSGDKVFPEEVESVVLELDTVKEAAVIGIDHKIFGQVVKLFVHKEKESELSISQIMSHCIKKLERYKVPVKIEFVDKIPRTDYGKIKRYNSEI